MANIYAVLAIAPKMRRKQAVELKVCDNCKKELEDDMICITINIYGKLRTTSNDISGLGKADKDLDFCYEHGLKAIDLLRDILGGEEEKR